MDNIIYIKKLDDYDEIVNCKIKMPLILKKIIFLYKSIFCIITKKNKGEFNIWILPFQEKISDRKIEKIIDKQIRKGRITENTKLVVANSLLSENIIAILKNYNINYFEGNLIKKLLIFRVLDYINNLQNKELNRQDITILANSNNEINSYIIEKIALNSKTTKIVSKAIYQFKNLEQRLYDDYGIAMQFSNSYRKSLLKSEIIINLDFNETEINEYDINNNAIIINTEKSLKIKSKLYNGIVVNSYKIKLEKQIRDMFNENKLLQGYDELVLYESIINWRNTDCNKIAEKVEQDNIKIMSLIGNNGIISKKEFKIMNQRS